MMLDLYERKVFRSNYVVALCVSLVEVPPGTRHRWGEERTYDGQDEPDEESLVRNEEEGRDKNNEETRDEGVPDEVWLELQDAKKRDRERLEELQREEEAYQKFLIQQKEAEIEAQRRHEEELERIRRELEREEQERALREAEEAERKRKYEEEQKRKREEEEHQKRQEEIRKKMEMMKRLQTIRPCPMGYTWHKQGGGWRCEAGGHFVSDQELKKMFGCDL